MLKRIAIGIEMVVVGSLVVAQLVISLAYAVRALLP